MKSQKGYEMKSKGYKEPDHVVTVRILDFYPDFNKKPLKSFDQIYISRIFFWPLCNK